MVVVLPPGTLLQLAYLAERLRLLEPGRFVEVGPGSGEITNMLLKLGWRGTVYDLEARTIDALVDRFQEEVAQGRLMAVNTNFVNALPTSEKVDLVISCMVMEHMEDIHEVHFMEQSARWLNDSGQMIGLVPGSPRHWGIEDDIAGHFRRYTREGLTQLMRKSGWKLTHSGGLTFPLSNCLLPVSNLLVRRAEKSKLFLSAENRTKLSGRRHVRFKTHFPPILWLLLNPTTIAPFHWLQKLFSASERALVLYFEAKPEPASEQA
ncbi:MAG: class I SAM-dependent methyltransferase [Burkholderiaceae bacterium]